MNRDDRMAEPRPAKKTASFDIAQYTKSDLKRLLKDDIFWRQPRLPITQRRVVSHISNSRAEDNDVVLLTASGKGDLLAYLGILPDVTLTGSQPVKFGWLTTWWVDRTSQHRLAATQLLFIALKNYSNRIAISSFSEDAKRVYDATNQFQQLAAFDRVYFIMASPPAFRILSAMTRWIAGAKNRLIFGWSLQKRDLEVRTVERLDDALSSFINKWAVGDPLARDASFWNWILAFPWISASGEDELAAKNYEFSVFAKDFRQIPLVINRRGATIAFVVVTQRNGRATVKYAYYDPADASDVAAALRVVLADISPWVFISADTVLNTALKKAFPFYFAVRRKSSVAYVTKAFPLSVGSQAQFGIGDNIFT